MYMHTLDGKPATYEPQRARRDGMIVILPWIGFTRVHRLVASIRTIRAQQRAAIREATCEGQFEWARTQRYGYVSVEVPHV
jgi:hypothetical protein